MLPRDVLDPPERLDELLLRVPTTADMKLGERRPCLVRADLDVPIQNDRVVDSARLKALTNTITLLRSADKIPILFGHIGRRPENTSLPLVEALTDLFGGPVHHVAEWFSDDTHRELSSTLQNTIEQSGPGSIVLLENTRKYAFETALWGCSPDDIETMAMDSLLAPASALSSVADSYISDCIASSNPDWSSLVLPFFVDNLGLAVDVAREIETNLLPCAEATCLIFSGLKPDKLDDLERIASRRGLRALLIGGALAFPFLAAKGTMSTDEGDARLNTRRVEQASRILSSLDANDTEVVLPSDFVRRDGSLTTSPRSVDDALDIGPVSAAELSRTMDDLAGGSDKPTAYMNGVFGKVEDSRFQAGTLAVLQGLRRMTELGATTYVGGGDCAAALRQLGDESWVSHVFAAGGTVLKAMSGRSLSYVSALAYAKVR